MSSHTLKVMSIAVLLLGGSAVIAYQDDTKPPELPPAHPPIVTPSAAQPEGVPDADPADVESVDAIVAAFYDSISGPKGEARNWDRFRSLFLPGARLMTTRPGGSGGVPVVLTAEDYIATNDTYFTNGGYFERELHRTVEAYGRIAHVFSTYGSQRVADAPQPYSRGINSFQLLNDGARWWIVSVLWDYERPNENPLPAAYLPEG